MTNLMGKNWGRERNRSEIGSWPCLSFWGRSSKRSHNRLYPFHWWQYSYLFILGIPPGKSSIKHVVANFTSQLVNSMKSHWRQCVTLIRFDTAMLAFLQWCQLWKWSSFLSFWFLFFLTLIATPRASASFTLKIS